MIRSQWSGRAPGGASFDLVRSHLRSCTRSPSTYPYTFFCLFVCPPWRQDVRMLLSNRGSKAGGRGEHTVKYSTFSFSQLRPGARDWLLHCSSAQVPCSAAQCSAVQRSAVQCSTVQCSRSCSCSCGCSCSCRSASILRPKTAMAAVPLPVLHPAAARQLNVVILASLPKYADVIAWKCGVVYEYSVR